ncbi:hypothetical protein AVEN_200570-1, partial [Araneus ventricosus]
MQNDQSSKASAALSCSLESKTLTQASNRRGNSDPEECPGFQESGWRRTDSPSEQDRWSVCPGVEAVVVTSSGRIDSWALFIATWRTANALV